MAVIACSTPGGVFVGFTNDLKPDLTAQQICSTPGGVFVGFTRRSTQAPPGGPSLLNARGRLCRVHSLGVFVKHPDHACSTPGGVFVGFTRGRTASPGAGGKLLNARGRLCRVHTRSRRPIRLRPASAQRPGASLSGSQLCVDLPVRLRRLLNARGRLCRVHSGSGRASGASSGCSTPGGVFVGFTTGSKKAIRSRVTAQRPGASLSGSPRLAPANR